MKTKRWILMFFVLIIFAFAQTQALAGFYAGNDLITSMREYDKTEANPSGAKVDFDEAWKYLGYITGVYDATEYLYNTPDKVTQRQLAAVVSKYLKNNPEKWNEPAALLVMNALQEAFPLKKSK